MTIHALWSDFVERYPATTAAAGEVEILSIHASELIDSVCFYRYDTTDLTVKQVLTNATCDQIAQWLETGDSNQLTGYAINTPMTLGTLTINGQPARVAPRALQTLRHAGLLNIIGE
jgi:hypothetical protein